jgi:uncharacterized membrane protein
MLSWIGHLTKAASIPATVEELEEAMGDAFADWRSRAYNQDVRFGIIVLSETAQRALSPAVNDPGTAIFIIDRITAHRVGDGRPEVPEPPSCPP